MKSFKKLFVGIAAVLGTVLLAGCSNFNRKQSDSGTPKSLNVQFVHCVASGKMEGRAKPIEKMLSSLVHVSVSTDNNGGN